LKANSAYKCVDEHEPQPILDYEWDNKKKKIVMDYLFKKTDGKEASIATGNIDSHRFISNESGPWYIKSHAIKTLVETASLMTTKLLCPPWITRNASILYSKKVVKIKVCIKMTPERRLIRKNMAKWHQF
jgi:hypothetical protein